MKCNISTRTAIGIKVFFTSAGFIGLGLMYYDSETNRKCDSDFFAKWMSLISVSVGIIGMGSKFIHDISSRHNCFFNCREGLSVTSVDDEESAPGTASSLIATP